MFRFTRKPLSGSHQRLAKIALLVQVGTQMDVQALSVSWLHNMTANKTTYVEYMNKNKVTFIKNMLKEE